MIVLRASVENNIQVASILISRDADVNAQDKDGWTPLHCASSAASWRIVNMLITGGARIDIPNVEGDFAIDVVGDAKVF